MSASNSSISFWTAPIRVSALPLASDPSAASRRSSAARSDFFVVRSGVGASEQVGLQRSVRSARCCDRTTLARVPRLRPDLREDHLLDGISDFIFGLYNRRGSRGAPRSLFQQPASLQSHSKKACLAPPSARLESGGPCAQNRHSERGSIPVAQAFLWTLEVPRAPTGRVSRSRESAAASPRAPPPPPLAPADGRDAANRIHPHRSRGPLSPRRRSRIHRAGVVRPQTLAAHAHLRTADDRQSR